MVLNILGHLKNKVGVVALRTDFVSAVIKGRNNARFLTALGKQAVVAL